MNKFLSNIVVILTLLVAIASCGEDRTYELEEKTQHSEWMLAQMKEWHIYGDTLSTYQPQWKEKFQKPAEFLKTLITKTGKPDPFSYLEVDTIASDPFVRGHFNHLNSYGFDFVVMTDPTGQTTKTYARVITVYPNSPAAHAKLKRNDFISSFNGFKITQKNAASLEKGPEKTLTVCSLVTDGEDLKLVGEHEVKLSESVKVEDVPFPVWDAQEIAGIEVGYLMCTRLVETDDLRSEQTEYKQQLNNIFQELKSAQVSEMVLDLRLCNYGTITMAQQLASYVVTPNAVTSSASQPAIFASTIWNSKHSSENLDYPYVSTSLNLNLGRLYILTSNYTRGAAEWLIRSLQATMGNDKVIVIGQPTAGQNMMTKEVAHDHSIRLCPSVALVADCNGNSSSAPIKPDETVDEFAFSQLYDYGNMYETLLFKALELMLN